MDEADLGHRLLILAERDRQAFRRLADDPEIHDSLPGFHAQQAVEKALKALLAHHRIAFRRTHDIAELLDLIEDAGLPTPPAADRLDELNPYAVEMRYGLIDPQGLDRTDTGQLLDDLLSWVGGALDLDSSRR